MFDKPGVAAEPLCLVEDHLTFLDDLRESGVTNMFGATPYLKKAFPDLTWAQARDVLSYWMDSFTERHSIKA